MSELVKSLVGGVAMPKVDNTQKALQQQQLQTEQARQADLGAQEAASRRALETGRVGRGLLAFTPTAPGAGKQNTLGA